MNMNIKQTQDVCVSGGVLFEHILYIVRLEDFVEISSRSQVFDYSYKSDGILFLIIQ
jgi:hypothetical protein